MVSSAPQNSQPAAINEFQGEHRWLSNFAPVIVVLDGACYPSVEHAYMAAKSTSIEWRLFCADHLNSAGAVKKASKKLVLRADWHDIKVKVMYALLTQKFAQEPYKSRLVATGNVLLSEGNRWGDTFWGVDLRRTPATGRNILGRLLMRVRCELGCGDASCR